jgi:hypothetical protein
MGYYAAAAWVARACARLLASARHQSGGYVAPGDIGGNHRSAVCHDITYANDTQIENLRLPAALTPNARTAAKRDGLVALRTSEVKPISWPVIEVHQHQLVDRFAAGSRRLLFVLEFFVRYDD